MSSAGRVYQFYNVLAFLNKRFKYGEISTMKHALIEHLTAHPYI